MTFTFEPIGTFRGGATYKYEAPRQGVYAGGTGRVELLSGMNFETALRELDGFGRIWLLFVFDRNEGAWRPTTRPPVHVPGIDRVGTLASRSPYRPNPIGLSCVRLVAVRGRTLEVDEADLLDGTPVLDIKPYVPAADAFPDAHAGWLSNGIETPWKVDTLPEFDEAAEFVLARGGPDIARTVRIQLSNSPFDGSRKRVKRTGESEGTLSMRMFRIDFAVDATAHSVTARRIRSGYSPDELAAADDPYSDKDLHRMFVGTKKEACFK